MLGPLSLRPHLGWSKSLWRGVERSMVVISDSFPVEKAFSSSRWLKTLRRLKFLSRAINSNRTACSS